MSGPKSSRYTLTAEQLKRILEEQERLRKEQEEKARKERESKEAKEYLAIVKSKSKRFLSMVQEFEQKALSMKENNYMMLLLPREKGLLHRQTNGFFSKGFRTMK